MATTCAECCFWAPEEGSRLGSCECEKFKVGYHYSEDDISDDEAHVENDEGWGFVVGPKFGCIHAEAKDDNP